MKTIVATMLIALGFIAWLLWPRKAEASPIAPSEDTNVDLDFSGPVTVHIEGDDEHTGGSATKLAYQDKMEFYAAKWAIDWRLLAAHVYVESRFNPDAYSTKQCYGLGQILCDPQDTDGTCLNNFPALQDWAGTTYKDLYDPDINLNYACAIIADNMRFGMPRAIAVYNSWKDHLSPVNGPFVGRGTNAYVAAVLRQYDLYKSIFPD